MWIKGEPHPGKLNNVHTADTVTFAISLMHTGTNRFFIWIYLQQLCGFFLHFARQIFFAPIIRLPASPCRTPG